MARMHRSRRRCNSSVMKSKVQGWAAKSWSGICSPPCSFTCCGNGPSFTRHWRKNGFPRCKTSTSPRPRNAYTRIRQRTGPLTRWPTRPGCPDPCLPDNSMNRWGKHRICPDTLAPRYCGSTAGPDRPQCQRACEEDRLPFRVLLCPRFQASARADPYPASGLTACRRRCIRDYMWPGNR